MGNLWREERRARPCCQGWSRQGREARESSGAGAGDSRGTTGGIQRSCLNLPFRRPGETASFHAELRIDLLVEDAVVVELKSVEKLPPVFQKQVLTYLRLLGLQVGLLLNFGAPTMKEGLHRIVNGYSPPRLRGSA